MQASAFAVDLSAAGPCVQIAAVAGAVGLYEARALERGVIEGICQGRTRVVLDLGNVTDVGPGRLGVLLGTSAWRVPNQPRIAANCEVSGAR